MHKTVRRGLFFILALITLIACGQVESPHISIMLGTEVSIFKNETVKVIGATKEDGKIVVEMEMDFNEITLENFEILLSGYEVDVLQYNNEETIASNESTVFSKGYTGLVSIVFTDDSIMDEHKLSKYTILVIYDDGDTRIGSYDYLLEDEFADK